MFRQGESGRREGEEELEGVVPGVEGQPDQIKDDPYPVDDEHHPDYQPGLQQPKRGVAYFANPRLRAGQRRARLQLPRRRVKVSADYLNFLMQMSSDDVESWILSTSEASDLLYTWFFRYPRLVQHDITNPFGTSNGGPIDFSVAHPIFAYLILGFVLVATFVESRHELKRLKKKYDNNSSVYLFNKFDPDARAAALTLAVKEAEEVEKERKKQLNKYIVQILQEDKEYRAKYHSIVINDDNDVDINFVENYRSSSKDTNTEGCDLFLMSDPNDVYKESNQHQIFLYRGYNENKATNKKEAVIFYRLKGETIYLHESFLQKISRDKFNQPAGNPTKCKDVSIAHAVLTITTERGHTRSRYSLIRRLAEWWKRNPLNKKVLSPLFHALFIAAAIYWSMWIGMGLFSGVFDTGIAGMSAGVGFGIPLAMGGLFLLVKMGNFIVNKIRGKKPRSVLPNGEEDENQKQSEEDQKEATKDMLSIMRRAEMRRIFNVSSKKLSCQLSKEEQARHEKEINEEIAKHRTHAAALGKEIRYLREDLKLKTATNFVSTAGGTFVWLQYIAWISMDFLTKVANVAANTPGVNLIAGAIVMGISILRGIYKATMNYFGRSDDAKQAEQLRFELEHVSSKVATLEDLYTEKLKEFNRLKEKQPNRDLPVDPLKFNEEQFFSDITRRGPKPPTDWGKVWNLVKSGKIRQAAAKAGEFFKSTGFRKAFARVWVVVNAFTTGVFLARVFMVAGNAPLLPFIAATGFALFSNPVTIGILAACGMAWAALKLYEYNRDHKTARSKQALEQYSEKMDCLTQQIKVVDLGIRVLNTPESVKTDALDANGVKLTEDLSSKSIFSKEHSSNLSAAQFVSNMEPDTHTKERGRFAALKGMFGFRSCRQAEPKGVQEATVSQKRRPSIYG